MTLWEEEFEGVRNRWLRWTDAQGELIPTGKQRAEEEAAARQAAETRVQQEAAARQEAEARVAELEALLGRRST